MSGMFWKNFFLKKERSEVQKVSELVELIEELKDMVEKLCTKIDDKIGYLEELEKRIDAKLAIYKNLATKETSTRLSKESYDKRNEVIRRFLNGEEVTQISKNLNMPIGEVELIINLFKIKNSLK